MVGKTDFNENPVVSLDLDLDFGLRIRVCQKASPSFVFKLALQKEGIFTPLDAPDLSETVRTNVTQFWALRAITTFSCKLIGSPVLSLL